MQNTKHYFHNNDYNGVCCSIFHITVKVCISSRFGIRALFCSQVLVGIIGY